MRILFTTLYPYFYMLLFLAIPFDNYFRALPNILMGVLAITFPFIVRKEHLNKLRRLPTLLFIVFCLVLIGNSIINNRVETDFSLINKVLLAFGLAILYIPIADSKKIRNAIVASSLAIILFSVVNIFIIINTSENIALGYSRQVIEALLIDRIYIGFISILSVLISYNNLRKEFHPSNKYHLAIILINILFVFLMVSKITVLLLVVVFLLRQLYREKKWLRFVGFSLLAVTLILTIQWATSPGNVIKPKENVIPIPSEDKSFLEQTLTWDLRTTIWGCVKHISDDHGLIWDGFGYEGTKDKLVACFESDVEPRWIKQKYIESRYNSHNQFVDIYFNFGWLALLVFLVFLVVTFFINRKRYMPTAFLLILVSYCLVENVFHRQIGAYYIGFVLIAILLRNDLVQNKIEKEE